MVHRSDQQVMTLPASQAHQIQSDASLESSRKGKENASSLTDGGFKVLLKNSVMSNVEFLLFSAESSGEWHLVVKFHSILAKERS